MATSKDLLIKQHSVIKFFTAEGCYAANIHERMKSVYGNFHFSDSTVKNWVRIFKGENPTETNISDRKRPCRPLSASYMAHQEAVD